ncbi:hypothetical protein SAMN02745823_01119 [Sporobacter termitidis DSM 10068]|uniref:Flagellar motility protein MotE, a chaperone for MotC folding n=1 Tax=Sporobacter termitidis DSM 10068 TaxID=1123282 RepID=A0A1M5W8E6_9FIRM|nr:hypothetical protein [Sporobacter termitidis]SHH83750.1 hypothetical protein SAMN02745823_01119 [Sporobacter termitidis DSM 10068]
MSPVAEAQKTATVKTGRLDGKEFEETFKPKGRDKTAKELEDKDKKGKDGKDGKDGKKGKKKKPKFLRILIIVMIILVLLGGAGAALYLSGNLNNIINNTLNAIGLQMIAPGTAAPSDTAGTSGAPDIEASASPEASITPEEPNVSDSPEESPTPEASPSPDGFDTEERTFEKILADFSEEKLTELKRVGLIYSKMDPAAAGAIMTNIYDPEQIAIIVYNMPPAASALLLAQLDAGLAAQVTKLMTS